MADSYDYIVVGAGILVSSASGTVYVVDVSGQQSRVAGTLSAGGRSLDALALAPGSDTIAAINTSGFVYLWDRPPVT